MTVGRECLSVSCTVHQAKSNQISWIMQMVILVPNIDKLQYRDAGSLCKQTQDLLFLAFPCFQNKQTRPKKLINMAKLLLFSLCKLSPLQASALIKFKKNNNKNKNFHMATDWPIHAKYDQVQFRQQRKAEVRLFYCTSQQSFIFSNETKNFYLEKKSQKKMATRIPSSSYESMGRLLPVKTSGFNKGNTD